MSARFAELGAPADQGAVARWCTSAAALLRRAALLPARPLAPLGTDDMPTLPERIRLIEDYGGSRVQVTVDPGFRPRPCPWCAPARPRVTSVRVWGAAPDDPLRRFRPLRVVAVCLQCALATPTPTGRKPRLGALGQALAEARPGAVVRVEVAE